MIVVDTGPLVALCDPRDRAHARARRQLSGLAAHGLATCEPVLVEAAFHLPHRSQRERLKALLEQFAVASLQPTADSGFWEDVLEWLLKYADHEPDWADGCLAVLSGRDARARIWTYDDEFRTTWRRSDGSAIPLAATARTRT